MTLNHISILHSFAMLANLEEAEAEYYLPMAMSAQKYFERLLKRAIADEEELELLTDAAAKKAFYDYTVLIAASQKTFSTRTGSVFARLSDDTTVINAQQLYYQAMAILPRDLINDDGFIFEGVAG